MCFFFVHNVLFSQPLKLNISMRYQISQRCEKKFEFFVVLFRWKTKCSIAFAK